jgi:23S rRNA (pseudouridine1915-N3)-methyltransferase
MRISLFVVGETRTEYLRDGFDEYARRLRHFCTFRTVAVPGEKLKSEKSSGIVQAEEWRRILKALPEQRHLIVLDRRGTQCTSNQLAERIQDLQNRSIPEVCFAVGGPLGFPQEALRAADFVLSLSEMTFLHEMTRLILLEQLYRAFMILQGGKYHK